MRQDITNPLISFVNPGPGNYITTANTSILINTTIEEINLNSLIYNWNGVNYTSYNNSLMLFYNFENLSVMGENDSIIKDLSKYGNNASVVSGAKWQSSGKYGGGYQFLEDTGNYINIPYSSSVSFTGTNIPFSISMWMKFTATNEDGTFVLHKGTYPNYNYAFTGYLDGKTMCWRVADSGACCAKDICYNTSVANQWHLWTGVYNGSNSILYVDGVQRNITSMSGAVSAETSAVVLGKYSGAATYDYNGSIDELKIWNRSLSAGEIYQEYISNLQKYDTQNWSFYVNQSSNATTLLSQGVYNYQVFAADAFSNYNNTEMRQLTIDSSNPDINFTSPTPVNTSFSNNIIVNVSVSDGNNISSFIDWNNSLVGWWKFNSDVLANDSSGYGNNGSVSGAVWNSSGKLGGAYDFDGVNDYVDLGNSSNLDLTTNFAISMWIYRNKDSGDTERLLAKTDSAGAGSLDWSYFTQISAGDILQLGCPNGDADAQYLDGSQTILTGRWYNTILVKNSTVILSRGWQIRTADL
ncbi:MAG: laminin G domain-containing protein, partial [Candidatus Aenigmarchaeota archaeon]|nr:laminin G domain-containing protein [Candidatus Aenigmarchaeota archaeon]